MILQANQIQFTSKRIDYRNKCSLIKKVLLTLSQGKKFFSKLSDFRNSFCNMLFARARWNDIVQTLIAILWFDFKALNCFFGSLSARKILIVKSVQGLKKMIQEFFNNLMKEQDFMTQLCTSQVFFIKNTPWFIFNPCLEKRCGMFFYKVDYICPCRITFPQDIQLS